MILCSKGRFKWYIWGSAITAVSLSKNGSMAFSPEDYSVLSLIRSGSLATCKVIRCQVNKTNATKQTDTKYSKLILKYDISKLKCKTFSLSVQPQGQRWVNKKNPCFQEFVVEWVKNRCGMCGHMTDVLCVRSIITVEVDLSLHLFYTLRPTRYLNCDKVHCHGQYIPMP